MQKECLILHAFFRGGLVLFSCVGQAVGAHSSASFDIICFIRESYNAHGL